MPAPEQSRGAHKKVADKAGQSNNSIPASGLCAQGLKIICPNQIVCPLRDDKQNLTT